MPDKMRFAPGAAFSITLDCFRTSAELFGTFIVVNWFEILTRGVAKTIPAAELKKQSLAQLELQEFWLFYTLQPFQHHKHKFALPTRQLQRALNRPHRLLLPYYHHAVNQIQIEYPADCNKNELELLRIYGATQVV